MRVLLTGGAGFIGTHTARALYKAGHVIRVLDCLDPQVHGTKPTFPDDLRKIAECIQGDICSEHDCQVALDGVDAVFHLASRTGVGQSMYDIGPYVGTNVLGTAVLLETIVKSRAPLKRFVLASSRAIYGEGLFFCAAHGATHPGLRDLSKLETGDFSMHCAQCDSTMNPIPTPTQCSAAPISIYAMTKWQQEEYCRYSAATFGLPLVILRYFNVYGSGQSLQNPYTGVVSIFYSLLKKGHAISLYEKGLPIRDFVHVADVVRANLLALKDGLPPTSVFNVGTGVASSIADIALAQARSMNVEAVLEDRGEYRIGDVFGCYADIADTARALGYRPTVDLASGMAEFVAWANGQESVDQYQKTVDELRAHGLFGKAQA